MNTNIILAIVAMIFGILVIVIEGLLRWIVGIFFILLGIWLLWDTYGERKKAAQSPIVPGPPPSAPQQGTDGPEQK